MAKKTLNFDGLVILFSEKSCAGVVHLTGEEDVIFCHAKGWYHLPPFFCSYEPGTVF
jgi:hypothetical protein